MLCREKQVCILKNIDSLKQDMLFLIKKNMDEDGKLPADQENKLGILKRKTIESNRSCKKLRSDIEGLERIQHNMKKESGIAIGTVFPNTMVKYGTGERLIMEKKERYSLYPGKSTRL